MFTDTIIQKKLYSACKSQNIKLIKHILESKKLKNQIDLFADNSHALHLIFSSFNEELIDYILNIPNIKQSIETHNTINDIFGNACFRNNLDILHFYFRNDKYNQFIDLDYSDGWFFRTAYKNDHVDILNFLILEVAIEKNKNVDDSIDWEKSEFKDYILKLFSTRELKNEISLNLEYNNKTVKKMKI